MNHDPFSLLSRVRDFSLTSSDVADGASLQTAQLYNGMGLDGGNESPQLAWRNFPQETRSFAVTCYDPDAPTMSGFWHWVVVDLPASITLLDAGAGREGALPGGVHLRNDYGTRDYGGAAPPPGAPPHRYFFTVHALAVDSLEVPDTASPAMAMFLIQSHAIARASIVATFAREE
jgi:Raf kinase inhibitor-like YbhB/YbcL family protein